MDKVIIDSSAWIESFRRRNDSGLAEIVKSLVLDDLVLLPGIIRTELLRGAKSKKESGHLKNLLGGLIYLPVEEAFWEKLADFSFGLFRKGLTIPLTDTYIALLCMETGAWLLHRDKHFDLIAKFASIKIYPRISVA